MTSIVEGSVALVTGSSSGIGAAVCRHLHAKGVTVVVNSTTSVDAGEALAHELRDGPGSSYIRADIADEDQAARLVDEVISRHGRLDILINNAGTTQVIPHADFAAATPAVWRRIFDVNVIGTWMVTVAAVPHLRAAGHGCVVNITSLAGVRPLGSSIPYAASKAALNHMTSLLAAVLGPEVRVNAVAPGLVDTPWTADWDTVRGFVNAQAPLRRSAQPDDVAHVVVSVVEAEYMTGEIVVIDGGMQLR